MHDECKNILPEICRNSNLSVRTVERQVERQVVARIRRLRGSASGSAPRTEPHGHSKRSGRERNTRTEQLHAVVRRDHGGLHGRAEAALGKGLLQEIGLPGSSRTNSSAVAPDDDIEEDRDGRECLDDRLGELSSPSPFMWISVSRSEILPPVFSMVANAAWALGAGRMFSPLPWTERSGRVAILRVHHPADQDGVRC